MLKTGYKIYHNLEASEDFYVGGNAVKGSFLGSELQKHPSHGIKSIMLVQVPKIANSLLCSHLGKNSLVSKTQDILLTQEKFSNIVCS